MSAHLTLDIQRPPLSTAPFLATNSDTQARVGSSSDVSPASLTALKGKLSDPFFAARLKAYPALALEEVGIEVSSATAAAIQKQMQVDNGDEDKNATQIIMVTISAIV
ncbi:hypothetical protein JK203_15795 [Gluconobacter cerinus]|uniref:hypothetical protein n=1 Tax=Gluconobacter cerinus TaxID=38307 RepID=UPI001B8C3F6D|nr:hypothetical protein [Gluconobacter cerinus]MBS1042275.1 hypothetical protein [Gluconobacter cerinus]MBS1048915.1 hypothetical protein [Gluconobacter cerinus]